jgi:prepilin-type N-terminal cleavage/methylation domain-containing protein
MQKPNLKKSFTLVELMTPSFKTQAFFKRQNPNEFVKKGASCHSKKSFTLVELMIVIAILVILSAIVIFALNPGRLFDNFRDTRRVSDINTINKAINFIET